MPFIELYFATRLPIEWNWEDFSAYYKKTAPKVSRHTASSRWIECLGMIVKSDDTRDDLREIVLALIEESQDYVVWKHELINSVDISKKEIETDFTTFL